MATEALKATALTNLDATPVVQPTVGEGGGPDRIRHIDGNVTPTTAVTSGSTYQLLRVPSNAKVKSVRLWNDAAVTTLTGDIGFYYSTSLVDGTAPANAGTKVNGNTGAQLCGAAVALAAIVVPTEESANFLAGKRQKPLWQACGLTSDPGGFFDLVLTTTATNSGSSVLNADLFYVE